MPRRQLSQHKLYTTAKEIAASSTISSSLRGSLKRSTTVAPSSMQQPKNQDPKYLVKRLAHYSSMADALVGGTKKQLKASDLNVSDKENKTPDQNYR